MKRLLLLFAALTCCFAMKAQSVTYEPIMSIPSPINSDAVYYLGYQDGQDFYLHTSGTTAGQMQLSKNPENPLEYHIELFTNAVPNFVYAHCGTNYLTITNDGVSAGGLSPFASSPYTLVIQDGDISSAAASGYTVCHDGNNIITTHTGTSEGNLRFFVKPSKPSYNINVSVTPEGAGSATATIGGEQVESATEGTEITVTATRNTGYKFVYWTENDKVVSYNNPYTFTLTADRNLVANFSRQYDFSATCITGQTLYYRIIDAEKHWVSIVAPNDETWWDLCWDGFTKPEGNITLPETVTHNDISYTVKAIGICAFSLCDGLTGSLSIPNSVTSIGEQAFNCCSGFTGSLTIGNSVTSIGRSAFHKCSGFTGSLTIGSSVTSIGQSAFQNCSGFTGSLIIGNSVTNIGGKAFELCSNFTGSLNIPNSVTSIGESAFESCSGFTGSLTIGNSVTSIGERAFESCSGFTGSLIIGSSVTSIGDNAFRSCSGFTNIIAKPATPPTLGNNAFLYISNLQTITVPCGNYEYYDFAWWISFGDIMVEGFVYDLTVASANNGFGSASITQQPDCSTPAKVTATPNDGYKFVNWTENGEVVSTDNPYIFGMATDRNLVANFVENDIIITANQDPDHKQNYYATFYSSAADYKVVSEGVTAYTGKVEDSTSEPNTSVLKLTAIEDNIIPASQGVILKLTTNDNAETQKQFVITLTTEAGTWSDTNELKGTDVAKTLGANDYALSLGQKGVGFYLWEGKEIAAHKAYLTLESPTMAKAFIFQFEDEITGINDPQLPTLDSQPTYNLNGVRVNDNYKGIVIRNGKKIYQK